MLGYVQIFKPDLKIREYEIYQGYYCGICKYIGKTYGQLPRMALSYDAAFLAVLLACVDEADDAPSQEHCVIHHIQKKTIIRNKAIEYAGDVMLLLAWYKLLDDIRDETKGSTKQVSAKAAKGLLRGLHKKLQRKYPSLCDGIEINLVKLNALEKARCASIDKAAESFSKIMEVIFEEGARALYPEPGSCTAENGAESESPAAENLHETFAKMGYHMGKWIYLIDAVDDIEENIEDGAYNPLLYRFDFKGEPADEFRSRIREDLEFNLYQYLAVLAEHVENLDIKKNSGIIENIIYFGMNRKTEEILDHETNSESKGSESEIKKAPMNNESEGNDSETATHNK